jgi:signal transduction histidine kinase
MATFQAKARAVELLGKGQIADLPTAITELWKNGYDAYARSLECKLYLESYKDNNKPVFILSDDGFGMTKSDILNRWFVLGTDSKARNENIQPHFGLKERIPMGEKGIGRLSVSYLGDQMLMLSKKEGQPASALLMDWRILDNYHFFLADLNIPLFNFTDLSSFTINLNQAKRDFEQNLEVAKWADQLNYRNHIIEEWKNLSVPQFLEEEVASNFCQQSYHGTTFIIFTPHEQLLELSDKDRIGFTKDESLKHLRSSLSGLHNDLKNLEKDFETHFYWYDSAGRYDLIDDFFTQDEMRNADHWLKGEFDEEGFFTGEIRIFGEKVKHTFKPNRPPGKTTYGPFCIEWGAVEGSPSNSSLSDEQFKVVNKKLEVYGGLYIYRDNFRVLPYGRTESDFLDFEKRRSLGATYYFFSARRFIGYIDIARSKNPKLIDKAGREGFIQNKAYRDFRDDLISFFIDIAKRYMRNTKDSEEKTFRESQLKEINAKYDRQQKAAKKKNTQTKKVFLETLSQNSDQIKIVENNIDALNQSLEKETEQLQLNYNNYNHLVAALEEKRLELRSLRLTKPRGIKPTKRQEEEYLNYQNIFFKVEDKLQSCIAIVEETRKRLNVENLRIEFSEKHTGHLKSVGKRFLGFLSVAQDSFNRVQKQLKEEKDLQLDSFIQQTRKIALNANDKKEDVAEKIRALEKLIEEHNQEVDNSVGGFVKHLSNLQIDVDDDFLRGWYQEQNEVLHQKVNDYEELAQLGMSIEIIDHQFNVMYSQMQDAINEIDRYARLYPDLESSYRRLSRSFQHLEGNYKLLKPLYRTSRRTREVIRGRDVEAYIKSFFANEFNRYRIDFDVNNAFRDYEFFTYDSIIKPVFLNLINNANYWLIPVNDRKIRIELQDEKILVMNSGERIDDVYLDDIFNLFFTRRRDGRGIGLHLAKKNLSTIGYDIWATNDKELNKLKGACFVISKHNNEKDEI